MSDTYVPVWRRFPPVVYVLLGAFVLIHIVVSLLPPAQQDAVLYQFALVPQRFQEGFPHWYDALVPLIGHAFLHANWLHLGMNCLAFLQAAPFVAMRIGQARFLVLYLVSALGGAALYLALHTPNIMLGASGAICGIFAAYFLALAPTPRAALAESSVRISIVYFLGINVVLVGIAGLPIAWQAHLGGFLAGGLVYPLLAPRPRAMGPWG